MRRVDYLDDTKGLNILKDEEIAKRLIEYIRVRVAQDSEKLVGLDDNLENRRVLSETIKDAIKRSIYTYIMDLENDINKPPSKQSINEFDLQELFRFKQLGELKETMRRYHEFAAPPYIWEASDEKMDSGPQITATTNTSRYGQFTNINNISWGNVSDSTYVIPVPKITRSSIEIEFSERYLQVFQ